MANINKELNKIKHAVYGKDVRGAIHDGIKKAYDDAAVGGNANMEVEMARGTSSTLGNRLDKMQDTDDVLTSQLAHKELNVLDYGAVGDGTTDNWEIIQGVIEEAEETGKAIYIPSGTYFVSQPLRTKHMTTPLYTKGIKIYGDGKTTILKGNGIDVVDYSVLENTSTNSVIALHGGNNILKDMIIRDATVGLFLGQHPDVTTNSNVGHNVIENVWFEELGTCVLLVHSSGNHYNKFNNLHFIHFQIGMHFSSGLHTQTMNNNRNMVTNVRFSRGWVGLLIESGDGNSFKNIYGEGMINSSHVQHIPQSEFTPDVLQGKAIFILALGGGENKFHTIFSESVDWDIYCTGYRYTFDAMTVDDDKILFPDRNPALLNNKSSFRLGVQSLADFELHFQSQDILSASPDIIATSGSATSSNFSRLGRITNWFFNGRFELRSDIGSNDRIRIKLPGLEKSTLNQAFQRETSAGLTMSYPVYVGKSGSVELVRARISTVSQADSLGYPHLIVPAPETGWGDGIVNNLNFSIEFHSRFLN